METLVNTITGDTIDTGSIDSMLENYQKLKEIEAQAKAMLDVIRQALWEMTEGDTQTRRVSGELWSAKVVQGRTSPSQSILKEIWNSFPDLAKTYLRVSSVAVQAREAKKLRNTTTDDKRLQLVKQMLEDAESRGSVGLPSVSIESSPDSILGDS